MMLYAVLAGTTGAPIKKFPVGAVSVGLSSCNGRAFLPKYPDPDNINDVVFAAPVEEANPSST